MAVYDIIPAGFNDIDLRTTLNRNGGSIPGTMDGAIIPSSGISGDFFNEKANININSPHKPIDVDAIFPLSDTDWRNYNYGFFNVQEIVPNIFNLSNYSIHYRFPTTKMRVSDFVGYNPKAEPVFRVSFPGHVYPDEAIMIDINAIYSTENQYQLSIDKILNNGGDNQICVGIGSRSKGNFYYKCYGKISNGKIPIFMVDNSIDWEGVLSKDIVVALFYVDRGFVNNKLDWHRTLDVGQKAYLAISDVANVNKPTTKNYDLIQYPIQGYMQYEVIGQTNINVNDNSSSYYEAVIDLHDKASAGVNTLANKMITVEQVDYSGKFRTDEVRVGGWSFPQSLGNNNYRIRVPIFNGGGANNVGKISVANIYLYVSGGSGAGKLVNYTMAGGK